MYARKRKLCAFYYTIGNLPRKFQGCLQGIRLAAVCSSNAVKKCGLAEILRPILYDISILESDGIYVEKLGRTIYGTIACVSADNLAGKLIINHFLLQQKIL